MKDMTEVAASQREDSEKGTVEKQSAEPQQQVAIQQGTTSGSTATTRPERPSVRRWEPLIPFDEMREDLARLWSRWHISEPMRAKGNWIVVNAELPGVKKEDITVEFDQGNLVIRGERHVEHQERQDRYYRIERGSGSFYHRLPAPDGVSADQIKAAYNDGILEVRIPRPQEEWTQAREIQIS